MDIVRPRRCVPESARPLREELNPEAGHGLVQHARGGIVGRVGAVGAVGDGVDRLAGWDVDRVGLVDAELLADVKRHQHVEDKLSLLDLLRDLPG